MIVAGILPVNKPFTTVDVLTVMIAKKLGLLWDIITETFKTFHQNNVLVHAAALSYYAIFSLPLMLLVILFTTTLFYDPQTVQHAIFGELTDIIGEESAAQLDKTVRKLGLFEGQWWTTVLGVSALLFTTTTVFVTIQDALRMHSIYCSRSSRDQMPDGLK